MPFHKLSYVTICYCMLVLAASGCSNNSPQVIDRILSSGNYKVSVNAWACFGNDTTVLNIMKDGSGQKAEFTFAGDTEKEGYTTKSGQMAWNADKEKRLRKFFAEGIQKKDKQACAAEAVYTLYAGGDTIKFTDDACEFDKKFAELMQ